MTCGCERKTETHVPRFQSPFDDILDCISSNDAAFTVTLNFGSSAGTPSTIDFSSLLGFSAFGVTGINDATDAVETVALKDVLAISSLDADTITCVTNSF